MNENAVTIVIGLIGILVGILSNIMVGLWISYKVEYNNRKTKLLHNIKNFLEETGKLFYLISYDDLKNCPNRTEIIQTKYDLIKNIFSDICFYSQHQKIQKEYGDVVTYLNMICLDFNMCAWINFEDSPFLPFKSMNFENRIEIAWHLASLKTVGKVRDKIITYKVEGCRFFDKSGERKPYYPVFAAVPVDPKKENIQSAVLIDCGAENPLSSYVGSVTTNFSCTTKVSKPE